jgi:four helix bundle protein
MDNNKKEYIPVQEMDIYKLARELSRIGWEIYSELHWQDKKVMGDQFIESTDSFGANFTEGYARYHFMDRIKFYYNARASLSEASDYWLEIMHERKKAKTDIYNSYKKVAAQCSIKLQNKINSTYAAKNNQK